MLLLTSTNDIANSRSNVRVSPKSTQQTEPVAESLLQCSLGRARLSVQGTKWPAVGNSFVYASQISAN